MTKLLVTANRWGTSKAQISTWRRCSSLMGTKLHVLCMLRFWRCGRTLPQPDQSASGTDTTMQYWSLLCMTFQKFACWNQALLHCGLRKSIMNSGSLIEWFWTCEAVLQSTMSQPMNQGFPLSRQVYRPAQSSTKCSVDQLNLMHLQSSWAGCAWFPSCEQLTRCKAKMEWVLIRGWPNKTYNSTKAYTP